MKSSLPIGRTIACVIAGLFVIAGAYFLFEGMRLRREFHEQSKTRPLDIPVDFSESGEFTAPFSQTWQGCHGQAIALHVPSNLVVEASESSLLASLAFKWQIRSVDDEIILDNTSEGPLMWQDKPHDGIMPLIYFTPCDLGDYTFTCTVTTGTPALSGVEQRLVCQYQPCGLELLVASFTIGIGITALVIAGIIFLIVKMITKRKRTDQTTRKSTLSSEGAPSDER